MKDDKIEARKIIGDLPTAIIRWYPFKKGSKVLFLGEDGTAADMLRRVFRMQVLASNFEVAEIVEEKFDYIVCLGLIELSYEPLNVLMKIRKLLAPNGKLLLGMNNRLGIRYFCGDRDPYTNTTLEGVENYRHAGKLLGRMYSKSEIKDLLLEAGLVQHKFYSVLPNLEEPTLLFAEGQLPKENLANRLIPSYNYPLTVFMEEEYLYQSLIDNGMFHAMSNAYLIECVEDGNFADALYVTSSLERGIDNAMLTIIHENGIVTKEAAYLEGEERIRQLAENMEILRRVGVPVVDGRLKNGRYVMPYIDEPIGQIYLRELLRKDKEKILEAMDNFREIILASSPVHFGKFTDANDNTGETELFDIGFLDMVPLNSFFKDDTFVFFDQEFSRENCPVGLIISRMIASFYASVPELENVLPRDNLYARYGLLETKRTWLEMEWSFLRTLRKENPLSEYHKKIRRNDALVVANRKRLNYPARDYRRLFLDIFNGLDGKKLILFGSGKYAREFMKLYRVRYSVYAIVDNNADAWGQEINGVSVQSPEILKKLRSGEYKVLICIKQFQSIMEQLEDMGVEDYGIFDPGKSYSVPRLPVATSSVVINKPYHIGYVAGVFDLFHIGHLNILRRAKEHCDYLIVGVVSDRQVREYKKVEPFVPFNERLDMVRSCKFVDEAHEIPIESPDTDMAWKLYHFDVQFSGSDYENDPVWIAKQQWLRERGAEMVFFPYTETTSSTKLKKLIEERLI